MKANMVAVMLLGMTGCAHNAASSNAVTSVVEETPNTDNSRNEHAYGDKETNEDGSITVYLNNGASFTVDAGTSDEEIDKMLALFGVSDDSGEETSEGETPAEESTDETQSGEVVPAEDQSGIDVTVESADGSEASVDVQVEQVEQ